MVLGNWYHPAANSRVSRRSRLARVTINDRERNIYVQRNFNFDGANLSTSTSFSTDAREKATIKARVGLQKQGEVGWRCP